MDRKPAYTAIEIDNLDGTFDFLKRDADGRWVKAGNEEWAELATHEGSAVALVEENGTLTVRRKGEL